MDENNVFQFDEASQRVGKFPTGMTMIATIKFQPEDDRDYYHKLIVKTTRTRFAIPIIGDFIIIVLQHDNSNSKIVTLLSHLYMYLGIGGRGLLNVSDSIILEKVPVKYYKTTIIPVYNLGTRPARFTLSTTG